MTTTVQINKDLLDEALFLTSHNNKQKVVEKALSEYIHRRKQVEIISLFNTIEFDSEYNYKKQRHF